MNMDLGIDIVAQLILSVPEEMELKLLNTFGCTALVFLHKDLSLLIRFKICARQLQSHIPAICYA